ncbi:MAG: hypothetical protein K6G23_06180, partial [Lachnospiraceae bacterium]|nr:hypothetical protein [Lachnospiraceae bacterium]
MNKKTRNLYITILTIVTVVAILFGSYIHLFRGVRFGVFTGKQASDSITFHDTVTDLDIDADAANLTLR